MTESQNNNSKEFNDLCDKVKEVTKGYIGDSLTQDQMKKMGDSVAHMFSTMFQDEHIKCVDVKNDSLNENALIVTISIPRRGKDDRK